MPSQELRIGQYIRDPRYDRNSFLGAGTVYTPNINWRAPKFYPFSANELVGVHLTDQEVTDEFLKPHSYSPMKLEDFWSGLKQEWFYARESLHFTLNGAVADHTGGRVQEHVYSWQDKKFAYLIPLTDLLSQTISLFTHDTIVLGQVRLPDSSVAIQDPTREKVQAEVAKLGYKPFLIQGVLPLDPAYDLRSGNNINHPRNFEGIAWEHRTDLGYVEDSDNNFLALDEWIAEAFRAAAKDNLLSNPERITEQLHRRIDFFIKKFSDFPEKKKPMERLAKNLGLYFEFLDAYSDWRKRSPQARSANASVSDNYEEQLKEYEIQRISNAEILLWENAQKLLQES